MTERFATRQAALNGTFVPPGGPGSTSSVQFTSQVNAICTLDEAEAEALGRAGYECVIAKRDALGLRVRRCQKTVGTRAR
jgi:hypothetical protein